MMLFSNYFVMYYIPCNYILIKSAGGRSAAALLRRDNVELSRVIGRQPPPGCLTRTKSAPLARFSMNAMPACPDGSGRRARAAVVQG